MEKNIRRIVCFSLIIGLSIAYMLCNIVTVSASNLEDVFDHFSSTSYILMAPTSKTVLVSFNEKEKLPVASICKLMTTLLVLEKVESGEVNLEDMLLTSQKASEAEGSQAFLDAGSKYSVKELLKSVIVASANDSAIVLAEGVGGNENAFVKMMNQRAEELGMKDTVYENSTGLNTGGQYSTAYDTCLILWEVGKYELYNELSEIWMDKLVHPSGRETELVNTNRLIRYYDYCTSGKTGYTDEAGYCLSSVATKNNLDLVAVTLNCKDSASRFKESMELYSYGFANYQNKEVLNKDNILTNDIRVIAGKNTKLEVVAKEDFSIVSKIGDQSSVTTRFEFVKNIKAPIKSNQVVGVCFILNNGVVVGEVELVSKNSIEKQNYVDILNKISNNWAL